jgi:hypothetical protein
MQNTASLQADQSSELPGRLPSDVNFDAAYVSSLWRVQHTPCLLLVLAVIGPLSLDAPLHADPNVHRRVAHRRRKREPHICYQVRG